MCWYTKLKKNDGVSTKPLPQDRGHPPIFQYGFYESHVIPEGKCSLKQALIFLTQHSENPTEHSVEKIAVEYKLDKEIVGEFTYPGAINNNHCNVITINSPFWIGSQNCLFTYYFRFSKYCTTF